MILLKFKRKTAGKANFKKAWQMSKGGRQKKKESHVFGVRHEGLAAGV